jgi:hypothetical protein
MLVLLARAVRTFDTWSGLSLLPTLPQPIAETQRNCFLSPAAPLQQSALATAPCTEIFGLTCVMILAVQLFGRPVLSTKTPWPSRSGKS